METVKGKDLGVVACGNCLEQTDVVVRMIVVTKDVDKRKAGVRVDLWMCPACGSRLAVNVRKLTSTVVKEGRVLRADFGRKHEQEAEREETTLSPAKQRGLDQWADPQPGDEGSFAGLRTKPEPGAGKTVDPDPGEECDD